MFNLIRGSCPYQNWTSVARERCPNPDHYHCLKDEYGRIGWVCSEAVWVEKDRCPLFNVGAKKLDTTSCLQTRCPPYNYRSNDVDVEYVCRYIMEKESSAMPFTTRAPEMNKSNFGIIITLTMLTLFTIIFVIGTLFFKRRRQQRLKNNGKQQESNKDLEQETVFETPTTVEPTNSSKQATGVPFLSSLITFW